MPNSWNNESLKDFVKQTLGCACPDNVFEKIEVSNAWLPDNSQEFTRIVVGDTLLIYVIDSKSKNVQSDHVKSLGQAGKTDRDLNRYNRFRLVFPLTVNAGQIDSFKSQFFTAFSSDEKMHIHFVDQELLSGL